MKKSIALAEKLKKLDNELYNSIAKLRSKYPVIPFYLPSEEDFEGADYLCVMDRSGKTHDVHLLSVDESGINTIIADGGDTTYSSLGSSDLVATIDRVNLLKNMETQIASINVFIDRFCDVVKKNERLDVIESMMDNHKCIGWGGKQYYLPEDTVYTQAEEEIFNLLYTYNQVK